MNEWGPPLVESPEQIREQSMEKSTSELTYGYHKKRGFFYRIKEKVAAEKKNYEIAYIYDPIARLEGDIRYERMMADSLEAIRNFDTEYDIIIINDTSINKILNYSMKEIPQRYWPVREFYEKIKEHRPIEVFSPKKNIIKGPTIKIYKME